MLDTPSGPEHHFKEHQCTSFAFPMCRSRGMSQEQSDTGEKNKNKIGRFCPSYSNATQSGKTKSFVVLNVRCQSVPIMKKVPPQIIRHSRCAEHLIE